MSTMPLALFGSIHFFELLVIGGAALLVFGPRLPEVSLRVIAQVMRARRAVWKMWRDTGLEDELRRVRRDIELSIPREADFDIRKPAPKPVGRVSEPAPVADGDDASDGVDPDADRTSGAADEPFDSSVTIEPADDIIASGDLGPDAPADADPDADRREPDGEAPEARD